MSHRLIAPLVLAIALLAAACSGSTDDADTAQSAETTAAPETTEAPETTAAPETTEAPEVEAADTTEPVDAGPPDGMAIYEANCARCHASNGGGRTGPTLIGIADKDPDTSKSLGLVANGGTNMPVFGGKLTEAEIFAVVDYVHEAFPAPAS